MGPAGQRGGSAHPHVHTPALAPQGRGQTRVHLAHGVRVLHTGGHACSPRKHRRHAPRTGHGPGPRTQAAQPRPRPHPAPRSPLSSSPGPTWLRLTVPHAQRWARGPDRRQDRRAPTPRQPGRSGAAGPGRSRPRAGGRHDGARTKRGGHSVGRRPRPTRAPRCEVTRKGASFVPSARPGRCGLCPRRVLPLPSPARAPDTKGAPPPPARAPPPAAPLSRGGGPPAAPQAAPAGAPEARRVLDALLELHRHGCGAALTGSRTAAPRAASSAARPARPPARAALRARPPRNEAAAPPPRPACHRRGASPKSAERGRRRCHRRGASPNALPSLRPRARAAPPAPTIHTPSRAAPGREGSGLSSSGASEPSPDRQARARPLQPSGS